jgi:hypothetical protein
MKESFNNSSKGSNINIEEIKCAARRMVVFERSSEGLVVTGVDKDGKDVTVETATGDWGLQLLGKREIESTQPE